MTAHSTAPVSEQAPTLVLQRAYLKDISLEIPSTFEAFFNKESLQFDVSVSFSSRELPQPGLYETELKATLTGKGGDKNLFLLEVEQAGMFEIRHLDAVGMSQALEVTCPSLLLPYLRVQVADILLRATLPVMHLPDVNWAAVWQQKHAQALGPQNRPQVH